MTMHEGVRPPAPDAAFEAELERALEEAGLRAGGSGESSIASVGDDREPAAVDAGDVAALDD
ncbi:hypothetical protein [Agrococcus versicolor]